MANTPRKSDGRRIFTDAFKRRQIGRVSRGELSLSELSRKLGIARSLLHRWKRHMAGGSEMAGLVSVRATSARELGAGQYIRELADG